MGAVEAGEGCFVEGDEGSSGGTLSISFAETGLGSWFSGRLAMLVVSAGDEQ